ncbi:MAG: GntR family transcriptional regulator, partial [Chloroflexi bacterium]|nr:GntR family transcriptional regulator [Chloroflexota bacterium]
MAALRQRILDGEFGTGGRLPPVRMLAKDYNVGPDLINKVLQRLQAEGLLISRGRTGVFVNKPRPRVSNNLALFHVSMEEQGLKAVEETLEGPSIVPAPEYAARAMGINEAVPVIYRLRRLGTSTVHYCLIESFYPTTLVDKSMLERMQHDERLDILSGIKEAHGMAVKEVREDVLGRFP